MAFLVSDTFRAPRLLALVVVAHHLREAASSRLNVAPKSSAVPVVPVAALGAASKRSTVDAQQELARILNAGALAGSIASVENMVRKPMQWIPLWAKPMPKCVESVNATVSRLERHYGKPQVPSVLVNACDNPAVYKDIGGSHAACVPLMKELGRVHGECGDQNYYIWCRNLYLNSSHTVKEKYTFMANRTNATQYSAKCSAKCPEVTKIIWDKVAGDRILADIISTFLKMIFGEIKADEHQDVFLQELELYMRLDNRVCDAVAKTKCRNFHLLPAECNELMMTIESDTDEELNASRSGWFSEYTDEFGVQLAFDSCDKREPCRQECEGVDALRVDFFMSVTKAALTGLPTSADAEAMCNTVPHFQKCLEHPSCEDYLRIDQGYDPEQLTEVTEEYCGGFLVDACYKVQEDHCAVEMTKLKAQVAGVDGFGVDCLQVLKEANMRPDENVTFCCQSLLNLAECNVKHGCREFMQRELNMTGLYDPIDGVCPQIHWALTTTTTTKLFDCAAGFARWERGWSAEKKEWCCSNENVACALFDCQAGLARWERGWSIEKKGWCCSNEGLGCTTTPPPDPYDCEAGLSNWLKGWSPDKKNWCCANRELGCPGQPSPGVGKESPLLK